MTTLTPGLTPAIVLTCQKYIPLAAHMIDSYNDHWPDHPFEFYLPDGAAARCCAATTTARIRLQPTGEGEGRGRFKAAVLGLLHGLDDDDWVYWCLDDKYLTRLRAQVARDVAAALPAIKDPEVAGLSFARARSLMRPKNVDASATLNVAGRRFLRRLNFKQIWLHQFLRAKVLRSLFGQFPDVIGCAKEMDDLVMKARLPEAHRLYVIERNAVQFGESTSRGKITANCAASLRAKGGIPAGFEVCDEVIHIGLLPTWSERIAHWFGLARISACL